MGFAGRARSSGCDLDWLQGLEKTDIATQLSAGDMLITATGAATAADAAAAVAALLCLDIYCVISVAVPKVCLHDCLH